MKVIMIIFHCVSVEIAKREGPFCLLDLVKGRLKAKMENPVIIYCVLPNRLRSL